MKIPYLAVFSLFFIAYSPLLFGQKYYFRSFSLEEGMPQSEAWDIMQDKRGNIWVGTNGGGVCRFNGSRFEVFNKKNGLPDDQVRHVFEDRKGNIWFFTFAGVAIYNGYKISVLEDENLIRNTFAQIYEDDNGRMWLYLFQNQNEYKLLYYENGKFTDTRSEPVFKDLYANNRILGFFKDKKGILYMDTQQGLFEFDGKKLVPSRFYQTKNLNIPKGGRIIPVLHDSEDNTWLIIPGNANPAKMYTYKDNEVVERTIPLNPANLVINPFEDSQKRIWFADGASLVKYDKGQYTRITQVNGLPSLRINSIMEDNEGNLWFGSSGVGIFKYSGDRFITFDNESGLKVNVARSIFKDSKGDFWFGMFGGFEKYDGQSIKDYFFNRNPDLGRIKSIFEESAGTLLFCTDAGLFRFQNEQITDVGAEFGIPPNSQVSYLIKDKQTIWIGLWGGGVIKYEGKGNITQFNVQNGSLRHNIIHSLYRDSKSNIWICSNLGLYKYDGKQIKAYTLNEGLTKDLIMQVAEDKRGRIWVATYGGGLNILENEKFTYITADNSNLASSTVYSIMADDDQNLWVGTQYGVDKITLDEKGDVKSIRNYNKNDGFLGVETNGSANYKDNEGNLWFGTIKGVMKYNPKEDKVYSKTPIIHLTNIRLFFRNIDWQDEDYAVYSKSVRPWFNIPENLSLPYDSNHVSFDFEAIHFGSPEKVRYQWKLEGVDKDWTPVTDKTEASYPNLMPGRYTFKVRACSKEGVWSEEPETYIFEIRPPWWQLVWVQTLFLGGLVGSVFAGVRIRIMAIKARQKELERLVDEKTIEVRKQNGEIMAKNVELEQQKEEILVQAEHLKEANKEITGQKEVIERKSLDITSSIEYAKRIQDAMLPSLDRLQSAVSEFFILFRPRDVVSGDFYWFAEKNYPESRKIIFAVVDCTGHGVPGAFMSMIGDSLLHHIIHDKEIHESDKILNEMHKGIYKTLNQDETYNRDGMDASLVVIDIPNDQNQAITIEFSGARSSLVYAYHDKRVQIKGDKMPIGGEQLEKERFFTKHLVEFSKTEMINQSDNKNAGITIHLFSDGYQDQFGGPDGKKFMTSRFRDMLFSIADMPLIKQKEVLEQKIDAWIEGQEQIDDILVVGIRI